MKNVRENYPSTACDKFFMQNFPVYSKIYMNIFYIYSTIISEITKLLVSLDESHTFRAKFTIILSKVQHFEQCFNTFKKNLI